MFKNIQLFFGKWFARFRAFCMLFAAWAVLFSVITLIGLKAGFEYDDGLVFSTPAFQAAEKGNPVRDSVDYWKAVNGAYLSERIKPVPYLTAMFFKVFGFKTAVICRRNPDGSEKLAARWKPVANDFYFYTDDNETYTMLEKEPFVVFFAASDAGIIQAKKAGVFAVRIKKSKKSLVKFDSNPGKYKEPSLLLSEF